MGAFTPKNSVDALTGYVIKGYVRKGLEQDSWRYGRGGFSNPGEETIEGLGTLSVAEEPERPVDEGYGDRDTVIVIKLDRENGQTVYFRLDATMDSYGDDVRLQSEPYEVVPKEVQRTVFERP